MAGLLFLSGPFPALGLFFLAAPILRLPTIGAAKAMLGNAKQEKKIARTIEVYLTAVAVRLAKHICMDEYKRGRTHNVLKASGMNLTLEVYQMYAFVKAGATPLGTIPYVFLLPLLSPIVVILFLLTYFKESQRADEWLKVKRNGVERELSRLVATTEQELKASRNIIGILERFKGNAGAVLVRELDILPVDICSSNHEAALTRSEARPDFSMLSDVVRGLIGVLHGDDSSVYFQVLARDFKQLGLQRLKTQTQETPPKIKVFSFVMLTYFLLAYLVIIAHVAVTSLGGMSQERREVMRLKGWIESHPQSGFDMMTPGGYVFLIPKQAEEFLERKDMKAHLDILGYDIIISAEELFVQNVVDVKWDRAVCHMLTDYIQKGGSEPPAPGQEVVMY